MMYIGKKQTQRIGPQVITVLAILSLAIVACDGSDQALQNGDSVTGEEIKQKAADTLEAVKTYGDQQREDFIKGFGSKLDAIQADIDHLVAQTKTKAGTLKTKTKQALEDDIDLLRRQKQDIAQRLQKLKQSGGKTWSEIKVGLDTAIGEIQQTLDRARAHLQES